MKQTITTREYDENGYLTRETVTEYDVPTAPACSCGQYGNLWCPLHGPKQWQPYITWCSSSTSPDTYTINAA